MHKEVLGGSSGSHINGDKFDNRRNNLRSTQKRPTDVVEEDFIKTVSPLLDHVLPMNMVPAESVHCTINYENGMIYQGEIHNYRPHGFGTLIEKEKFKTSLGWWLQGVFRSGIVMYHTPIPEILRTEHMIPQVKQAMLVVDGVPR